MPKFIIKFKGVLGHKETVIESDCKRNAMIKFNERFRNQNFEIKEIIEEGKKEDNMNTEIVKKQSMSLEEFKELQAKKKESDEKTIKMLEETNEILFEQLKKFKDIDLTDREQASMEIAKNNSLAGTAKTLVQSVSIKTLVEKQKGSI